MGTLADLKQRVLDEIKRPSLTSQVSKAILDAIEFYAVREFWFNTVLDETITTEATVAAYTVPTNLRNLLHAEITVGGQRDDLCMKLSWPEYRFLMGGNPDNSDPTDILLFGTSLYLYPTPSDAFPLALTYTSSLGTLADDTGSNAWTTEAEPLIRAKAKWILLHDVVRAYDEADRVADEEYRWYAQLQGRDAGRGKPTRVMASCW